MAGGRAEEGCENNVFTNRPLRATAKIPGRIATGSRIWKQAIGFRDDGPLLVQFVPDRLADEPAVIEEVCARNVDRVITNVGIEACLSELVSCDADESNIRIASTK